MDIESVDSCNICMDAYDGNVRPRCLPCGHNFCTVCITNSISGGILSCAYCQKTHHASSANDFPIVYGLEAVILELRKAKLGAVQKEKSTCTSGTNQSGSKWQAVFSDEKQSLKNLVENNREMQSEMSKYKEFLLQRKTEHEEVIPKIYALAHSHEEMVRLIGQEDKILTEIMKEGKELDSKAESTLNKHCNVKSTKDIIAGSEEVGSCYEILDAWRIRVQTRLPNAEAIRCSERIMRETNVALSSVSTEVEEETEVTLDGDSSLSLMSKVELIKGGTTISTKELKDMSGYTRSQLEKGLVYAIQNKEGQTRSAKVSLKNGKTYLHYLQDKEPPINSLKIQHSELLESLKIDSVETFLDLAWAGSIQGRIHIHLSPDTPLARHFRTLCTADLGPSYVNSRLLEVERRGQSVEWLCGGDYERNDGTGGAKLFAGVNRYDNIYKRTFEDGLIWARHGDDLKIAQFVISAGKYSGTYTCVFGKVTDGIDIVRAAIQVPDVTLVKIEDCGVVLPF